MIEDMAEAFKPMNKFGYLEKEIQELKAKQEEQARYEALLKWVTDLIDFLNLD